MEQSGPKQESRALSNSPPFHGFEEYRVTMEPNAAYHPYFSPDCPALLQAGPCCMSQPGIVGYYQPPLEFTLPVLFTSLAPYPPPYIYQPMAVQLAALARIPFYMDPSGTVVGPILVTAPYYCGQPYGFAPASTCAPVGHVPQDKPGALFQGSGPWQESQNASHKLAHGLPLPGPTPIPHEQILRSEKQCRLRNDKRTEKQCRLRQDKRTAHVLWVGNIDPTATLDELYDFFRQVDSEGLPPSESAVVSIHMIPKTRCALVNYKAEPALLDSVERFHGMRLRHHLHAPRLSCHRKEQSLSVLLSNLDGTNDAIVTSQKTLSRYFVMKSHTNKALLESVETEAWRTKVQNEVVLDAAYHQASVVYLIFGANKSGEFLGYAKMSGPIYGNNQLQLHDVNDAEHSAPGNEGEVVSLRSNSEPWGKPFPIEWIIATALPFSRVRHLRNPWNGNREVKLSNDGSELETRVGEHLLSLWTTNETIDVP